MVDLLSDRRMRRVFLGCSVGACTWVELVGVQNQHCLALRVAAELSYQDCRNMPLVSVLVAVPWALGTLFSR